MALMVGSTKWMVMYHLFFYEVMIMESSSITKVQSFIREVASTDFEARKQAQIYIDGLVKPPGSLGRLESVGAKIAGITGKIKNKLPKKCIIVMCSDNGVVDEGVASAPKSVTLMQTLNFAKGIAGVSVLAKQVNADVIIVDVGVDADIDDPKVIDKKIRKSTWNISKGPAMTYEEACQAILIGIDMVKRAKDDGYQVIGTGEMGIGNTSTSSAILTAYTGLSTDKTVGKGAGASEETYNLKKAIVSKAIEVNQPNLKDPIDVVAKLGGFDIAALAGVYIGAAYYRVPVIMDGFISSIAALIAVRLNEKVKDYIIESHDSVEHGFSILMQEIGMQPMFNMGMRLGEGSGCPLTFTVIDLACAMVNEMATFGEAQIDTKYLEQISEFEF